MFANAATAASRSIAFFVREWPAMIINVKRIDPATGERETVRFGDPAPWARKSPRVAETKPA
jgi:hypothetical protein